MKIRKWVFQNPFLLLKGLLLNVSLIHRFMYQVEAPSKMKGR